MLPLPGPITTILEADEMYTREPDEEELKAWDSLMPRKKFFRNRSYVMK